MKTKIILISTLIAGVFAFTSCLNDTADYWNTSVAGKAYATVVKPALQTLGLKPVADSVTYTFMINIATDVPPTSDITVNLKVDPTAVTAYNTLKGKSFLPYPYVRIVNPSIVIAKGTRTATVQCKIWNADKLSACDNFIAAVTIDNLSDPNIQIASNMKSYLLALPISNPYEGDYHCVGYRKHPTLGIFTVDKTETASTINCNTIKKSGFGDYPYDVQIEITTDILTVGGVPCYKCNLKVIDPSTNDVVSSGYGQYASFTGDATQVPIPVTNDVNYYNPVTKSFILNMYYNSSANRLAYEVLTKL